MKILALQKLPTCFYPPPLFLNERVTERMTERTIRRVIERANLPPISTLTQVTAVVSLERRFWWQPETPPIRRLVFAWAAFPVQNSHVRAAIVIRLLLLEL